MLDLDNTLSDTRFNEVTGGYDLGKPFKATVEASNALFDKGWTVTIFTARPKSERRMVKKWLIENGVLFDGIKKKPKGLIVDDRSMTPDVFDSVYGKPKLDTSSAFNRDNDYD